MTEQSIPPGEQPTTKSPSIHCESFGALQRPKLIVGDEVIVGIRAKVMEVGTRQAVLSLFELLDQYRVREPPIVYVPLEMIETRCAPERLGPEVKE